jgi:hypothetical protein
MAPAGKGEVEATEVEATLEDEDEALERLEEYLRRGRRLKPLWDADLIDAFVLIMNQWADGSSDFSEQNLDDYVSEMILRDIEPPLDRVEERLAAAEAKFETNLQKFRDIAKQSKR